MATQTNEHQLLHSGSIVVPDQANDSPSHDNEAPTTKKKLYCIGIVALIIIITVAIIASTVSFSGESKVRRRRRYDDTDSSSCCWWWYVFLRGNGLAQLCTWKPTGAGRRYACEKLKMHWRAAAQLVIHFRLLRFRFRFRPQSQCQSVSPNVPTRPWVLLLPSGSRRTR